MRFIFLISAFALAGCGSGTGSGKTGSSVGNFTVKGAVTHTRSGLLLAGATITRLPKAYTWENNVATADSKGSYSMQVVGGKSYSFAANMKGYGPITKNATISKDTTLNFALEKIYYDGAVSR